MEEDNSNASSSHFEPVEVTFNRFNFHRLYIINNAFVNLVGASFVEEDDSDATSSISEPVEGTFNRFNFHRLYIISNAFVNLGSASSMEEDDSDATSSISEHIRLDTVLSHRPSITFKRLLQHFAVYTRQGRNKMLYLLKLLLDHKPEIDYDSLPRDAKCLLAIDSRDWSTLYSKTAAAKEAKARAMMLLNRIKRNCQLGVASTDRWVKPLKKRPLKLAPARSLPQGGKYMHFGLEAALKVTSIGIIHKNALLFQ